MSRSTKMCPVRAEAPKKRPGSTTTAPALDTVPRIATPEELKKYPGITTNTDLRHAAGLYHVLADHHRGAGAGENPFRVAFRHVFQAYVGELLRQAVGANAVLPERAYRDGPSDVDTVDWHLRRRAAQA